MIKSVIGLGLAALGRPEYINVATEENRDKSPEAFRENAFRMLDAAYQRGVRYFDTAPSYGMGEQFLIDWHQQRKYSGLKFGTKWGYTYMANWELGYEGKHEVKEHSLTKLKEQWEVSKQLLPDLSFYQIHSATFDSGVLENKEVLEHLHFLKNEHNIQMGLTTSGPQQPELLRLAQTIEFDGEPLFTVFQVTFNVYEQSALGDLKQLHHQGKTIIIKEALANGRLFQAVDSEGDNSVNASLQRIATRCNIGIDALALRYCMQAVEPDFVLSGATNIAHLEGNLQAQSIELSEDDMALMAAMAISSDTYWEERSQLSWQ